MYMYTSVLNDSHSHMTHFFAPGLGECHAVGAGDRRAAEHGALLVAAGGFLESAEDRWPWPPEPTAGTHGGTHG
jgi:hypothetical protein